MTDKQIEYLNKVKVYVNMLHNAAFQLEKLWMEDIDHEIELNDFLAPLFPFNDSFDQVVMDIKKWKDDFEYQLKKL